MDQKLRLRNFDARNERNETGAVVTSRTKLSGIERRQGVGYQWKAEGQYSRGDQCRSRHDGDERAKINTKKPFHPSEPPTQRGRSASRKRNLRGRSPSGKSQSTSRAETSCKVFAQINVVTVGILPNVNFISQNRVLNSAISARFRTGRLRNNQIKSRKRVVTKVPWLQ